MVLKGDKLLCFRVACLFDPAEHLPATASARALAAAFPSVASDGPVDRVAPLVFFCDEKHRTWKNIETPTRRNQHPPPSVSAAYRDHIGPWAGLGSSSNNNNDNDNDNNADGHDEAPLLLQKARYVRRQSILPASCWF